MVALGVVVGLIALLAAAAMIVVADFSPGRPGDDHERASLGPAAGFGSAGLAEPVERDLPRCLSREFGQSNRDERAVKASGRHDVSRFDEDGIARHYWRIPAGTEEPVFASLQWALCARSTPAGATAVGPRTTVAWPKRIC